MKNVAHKDSRQPASFGGLTGILVLLLLGSCAPQKFAGSTGAPKPAEKPAPKTKDELPTQPVTGCTEARLLSIRNLVSFVDQKNSDRSVDIELTFEPCKNQNSDLKLPFQFDLDALLKFGNNGNSLEYNISFSGPDKTTTSQGNMTFISGSDLFGKVGPTWGHFESEQDIMASPLMEKAVLKLSLSNVLFLGRPESTGPMTSNFSVPMNVKVGNSNPIKVDIMLSPP